VRRASRQAFFAASVAGPLAIGCAIGILSSCSRTKSAEEVSSNRAAHSSWNAKNAANYLDQREVFWMGWSGAARDHGTFCVACHTALPYALARPVLRQALGENVLTPSEQRLVENVTKRVSLWNEIAPYYSATEYDKSKPEESRGTEAVLNAFILASYDAQAGHMSDAGRAAFRHMWELQHGDGALKGAWSWQQFNMEPFEAKDSLYYGACLAVIAVGTAPENYRSDPAIQGQMKLLADYLNREYPEQSTMNHVVLLWAASKLPGLITPDRQEAIIKEVFVEQQADGGWKLAPLAWPRDSILRAFIRARWRADGTRQYEGSDGYATAMIAYALQQAGVPDGDPRLQRALAWLERNQNREEGFWPSFSLTKRRAPSSNIGHFMDDAATGFAVLALSQSKVKSETATENASTDLPSGVH
jgi:squalene-hopene/tetraprenyl-beta-curcumene cyclase